jgi:hypothetical protein
VPVRVFFSFCFGFQNFKFQVSELFIETLKPETLKPIKVQLLYYSFSTVQPATVDLPNESLNRDAIFYPIARAKAIANELSIPKAD